jgi:hypothetical protein
MAVACPDCGAQAGEGCYTDRHTHRSRIRAAVAGFQESSPFQIVLELEGWA